MSRNLVVLMNIEVVIKTVGIFRESVRVCVMNGCVELIFWSDGSEGDGVNCVDVNRD
jgi:hypothetical protein